MKRKGLVTIFAVAAVILSVVNFVSGISGLVRSRAELSELSAVTENGSICEVKVTFAKEIYTVKHKLNIIFPFGTEHYYIAYDDSADPVQMLIKASRGWFDRNFTETGLAKSGSVTVKGEVFKFESRHFKEVLEINRELSAKVDKRINISPYSYLNSQSVKHHILKLISGAMLLIIIGALAALLLMKEHSERRVIVSMVVLLISMVGYIVSSIALKAV